MNLAETPLSAFPHDAAYKAMYGHPEAIVGLRPYLAQPNGPLAEGTLAPDAPRPLTLPVVIHNGAAPWRAPRRLADWTLAGLPDCPRMDLASTQASIGLHVVDFASHRADDLIEGSLTSLQIGIEHAGPSDFARLLPAIAELPGSRLRRRVYDWVRLRAQHYFRMQLGPLEDEDMSVGAFRSRIDENMKQATEAWFNDGLNLGLERQRDLLKRLIAAKFGDSAAANLAALVAATTDWETLGRLGEVVVRAGDESQLLAQAQAVVAMPA